MRVKRCISRPISLTSLPAWTVTLTRVSVKSLWNSQQTWFARYGCRTQIASSTPEPSLLSKRVQCDEIWSFVYAKEKNVPSKLRGRRGFGDVWTWVAIDADTKFVVSWLVGSRDAWHAYRFMRDVARRVKGRVQLTTDGLNVYPDAVDRAFPDGIGYAQLVKHYGEPQQPERRYSPAVCVGATKAAVTGWPDRNHISTSFVERQNLTMRMSMRRFTRLTNAFSKKVQNHEHAIALHFTSYNFVRIHKTLNVSPAMAAGMSKTLWNVEDLARLTD